MHQRPSFGAMASWLVVVVLYLGWERVSVIRECSELVRSHARQMLLMDRHERPMRRPRQQEDSYG